MAFPMGCLPLWLNAADHLGQGADAPSDCALAVGSPKVAPEIRHDSAIAPELKAHCG